jgi:metal-responsive CopG/Arc/MetJ family transcriptional regulator
MANDSQMRLNLLLSSGLLAALDEWRRQERDIPTRSEAARRLIAQALKASGRIGVDPDGAAATRPPRKR